MKYKLFFVSVIFLISCQQQIKKTGTILKKETDTVTVHDTITAALPFPAQGKIPENILSAQNIIAGQKVGIISIGEQGSSVAVQLGSADFGDAAMQKSISGWYSKTDSAIQIKIYFENDMTGANTGPHVVQIRVNSTFFKTAEGITTGSNLEEIKKYYSNIQPSLNFSSKKGNEKIIVMNDDELGIAFEIDSKNICKGITVHKPGHELFGYLQFYE